jgi:ATP-dependent 26S proteasome regulatory subunit
MKTMASKFEPVICLRVCGSLLILFPSLLSLLFFPLFFRAQDEVDAIATKRFDAQTGADREVQRILLELLNQMDGFDQTVNVKVIMATNRQDTLDPALLRPGRLDRKIEFPNPDRRQKRLIFQVCTAKMNLSEEIELEDYVQRPEKLSAADISAIWLDSTNDENLHATADMRESVFEEASR